MDQNTQGRGDEVGRFSIDIWEIWFIYIVDVNERKQ